MLNGEFREDLFYRLSVFPIRVPPLRERKDDVVQLARHFLDDTLKEFGRKPMTLSQAQVTAIRSYDWPGNVRELKNLIERAVILSKPDAPRLELPIPAASAPRPASSDGGGDPQGTDPATDGILTEAEMKALQKSNLEAALRQTGWKVSGKDGAAALLGVKPTTLADRIRALKLKKPS